MCDRCRGDGWIDTDGEDYLDDIILIDGSPHWVRVLVDKSPVHAKPGTATGDENVG